MKGGEGVKEDLTIVCQCGQPFTFSKGEQEFYNQRGFQPPKRCPACRIEKKRRSQEYESQGNR